MSGGAVDQEKKPAPPEGTDVFSGLKDRAVFLGWIAALVVLSGLVWTLTQPLRARALMHSVNKALELGEDSRRLSAPLEMPNNPGGTDPLGIWYSLINSDKKFFVFAIMRDGILVPCGAQVSAAGAVEEIIPLGLHARQILSRIPGGLIQTYTRRIENAAAERENRT
jgi:hypothetical protein